MRSLLLLLLVLCTACSKATPITTATPAPTPAQVVYVALGDSYTAAPYVVETDVADGCLRSNYNYPHLIARKLHAKLNDVSCGSATTANITGPQKTFGSSVVPAQLQAIPTDADLITLGVGGNDGGVFRRMISGCPITGPGGEQFSTASRCAAVPAGSLDSTLAATQRHLERTLKQIRARAPKALIILVGYPRLLGETGCKELPIADTDTDGARHIAQQLRDVQRRAARAQRVRFVDMHELSAGHDACSAVPWVRGIHTDQRKGAAMHPTPAGQQAVAKAIESVWSGSSR